jgi:hypothetical protein
MFEDYCDDNGVARLQSCRQIVPHNAKLRWGLKLNEMPQHLVHVDEFVYCAKTQILVP